MRRARRHLRWAWVLGVGIACVPVSGFSQVTTSGGSACSALFAPDIQEIQDEIKAVPALMPTPAPPTQLACLGSILNGVSFGFPSFDPTTILKSLINQVCSAATSVVSNEINQVTDLNQLLQLPDGLDGLQLEPNGSGGFSVNPNNMSDTAAGDIWNQINANAMPPGYNWTNSLTNPGDGSNPSR